MVLMDVLSNCLKAIVNAERAGKRQVLLRPVNKIVIKFLRIMQKKGTHCSRTLGYVGEFEIVDDKRSKKIVLDLLGRLNKCGVYSPRFDIGIKVLSLSHPLGNGRDDGLRAALTPDRLHRHDHHLRHHGPRRSPQEADRRQNPRLLLLASMIR